MAKGWFLNVRTLGMANEQMVKAFDLICFYAIKGKHFLHAFDLPIIYFIATLSISTCASFVSLQKFDHICLMPLN